MSNYQVALLPNGTWQVSSEGHAAGFFNTFNQAAGAAFPINDDPVPTLVAIKGKYWVLTADNVTVKVSHVSWEIANYCLLRWGVLPVFQKAKSQFDRADSVLAPYLECGAV